MAALFGSAEGSGGFVPCFWEGLWFLHIDEPWSVLLDISSYPFKSVFIVLPGFRPLYFIFFVWIITGTVVHVGVMFSGWMGEVQTL